MLLQAWIDQPEPGAFAAVEEGRVVAAALGRGTACGVRLEAVHGSLPAMLATAIAAFPGQRLEAHVDSERIAPGVERALAEAGFGLAADHVRYRGALVAAPPTAGALSLLAYADVGARGLRRVLERVWTGTPTPLGRAPLEELAELLFAADGATGLWRVAFADGQPVGVALAELDASDQKLGILVQLGVVRGHGEGVDRALLREALRLLRGRGARRFVTAAPRADAPLRRRLEEAGARPAGAVRVYARGPGEVAARVVARGPGDGVACGPGDGVTRGSGDGVARITDLAGLREHLVGLGLGVGRDGDGLAVHVPRPAGVARVVVEWEAASATVAVGAERLMLDRDGALDPVELRVAAWRAARLAAQRPVLHTPLRVAARRRPGARPGPARPEVAERVGEFAAVAPDRAEPLVALGPPVRLSASPLWGLQRRYFRAQGIHAWSSGTVPQQITTNSVIARAYADVAAAFVADCAAAELLDPGEPVHVVELGCGSGRFAHRFLAWRSEPGPRHRATDPAWQADPGLRYWATDFAEENLDFLERHPALREPLADGRLELAAFDAAAPAPLTGRARGETLLAQPPKNPLIVLANYVFDGVPQDAFAVAGERLAQWELALSAPAGAAKAGTEHLALDRLHAEWSLRPTEAPAPPLADGTTFFDPTGARTVLEWLADRAPRGLLVISADRGALTPEQLELHRGPPQLGRHGSVSFDVNYHALGAWAVARGGSVLAAELVPGALAVQAQVHCDAAAALGTMPAAFAEHLGAGGHDDLFRLKPPALAALERAPLSTQLSHLQHAGWDSNVFLDLLPALHASAYHADRPALTDALAAADRIERHHLALPGDGVEDALGAWRAALTAAAADPRQRLLRTAPYSPDSRQPYPEAGDGPAAKPGPPA